MPATYVQCRYLRKNGEQCTAEVADEHAEILLCTKHLARAVVLVRERTQNPTRENDQ